MYAYFKIMKTEYIIFGMIKDRNTTANDTPALWVPSGSVMKPENRIIWYVENDIMSSLKNENSFSILSL
jgi:hypothetical protein